MNKKNKEFDIVVVGAGPAAYSFCYYLDNSFRVLVLEKSALPRYKACGGLLTDESQEFLKKEFNLDLEIFLEQPSFLDLMYLDMDNDITLKYTRNYANIDRMNFDNYLLRLLQYEHNVQFLPETRFLKFEYVSDGTISVVAKTRGTVNKISCKYLVGSDGAISTVRRSLGIDYPLQYMGYQEYYNIRLLPDEYSDFFICIFFDEITDFYSWIIPKGKYFILGSAVHLNENIKRKFSCLKRHLSKTFGFDIGVPLKIDGAIINRPMHVDSIFLGDNNQVFLIGEAAGLISPSTAEGMSYALRSGKFCALSLNKYFDNNPQLKYYEYCGVLINEIESKLKKAHFLSNKKIRKSKLMNTIKIE